MLSTWCRASELVQIRRDDIRGEEVIVHGKGDKDRKVYLNAKARFAITQYLQERKDANSYLFPKLADSKRLKSRSAITPDWYQTAENVDPDDPMGSGTVNGLVKQIGKKGGVENTHAHRFRRTGATLALRHGMPLTTVSKILGHASIETTQIYLDISDEEMKDAHRKYVN